VVVSEVAFSSINTLLLIYTFERQQDQFAWIDMLKPLAKLNRLSAPEPTHQGKISTNV